METLQVPSEIEPVVAIYRERRPDRVLEIGCWDGGTLLRWLTEHTPRMVVAVDLEHRNRAAYAAWRDPSTTLHVYTCSSLGDEGQAAITRHAPYDWVMIDGDHTDHGVRVDVATCLPLINPGGVMLLHDITPPGGMDSYPPGVVFTELRERGYRTETYADPAPAPWSRGIGVVHIP